MRRHCGLAHDVVAAVFGVKMPEIATRRQCRSTQHVVAAKEGRMRPQNGHQPLNLHSVVALKHYLSGV